MKLNVTKLRYNPSWDIKHFKCLELRTNKALEWSAWWMAVLRSQRWSEESKWQLSWQTKLSGEETVRRIKSQVILHPLDWKTVSFWRELCKQHWIQWGHTSDILVSQHKEEFETFSNVIIKAQWHIKYFVRTICHTYKLLLQNVAVFQKAMSQKANINLSKKQKKIKGLPTLNTLKHLKARQWSIKHCFKLNANNMLQLHYVSVQLMAKTRCERPSIQIPQLYFSNNNQKFFFWL